jgi:hypothetical protein
MHERRLAALVTDTGVTDVFYDWEHELPHSLLELLAAGKADEFDQIWDEIPSRLSEAARFTVAKRSEIYGNGGGFERMSNARQFKMTRAEARRITLPTAITAPALEAYFPGQQQKLHRWLGANSTLLPFTVAEGGEYHCEPMAPQLRNERVFDWLETNARPLRA